MALISVFTAEPGKGKTQAALLRAPRDRVAVFCPTPRNKNAMLNALDWVYAREMPFDDEDALTRFQRENKRIRIVLGYQEGHLLDHFMGPQWDNWTFIFDDFPQLFITPEDKKAFVRFAAGVRHREGVIIITTQRVLGILDPYVRVVADELAQVGPLVAEDEARNLYVMGGSARYPKFRDFYTAISRNPAYKLFVIKGEIPLTPNRTPQVR